MRYIQALWILTLCSISLVHAADPWEYHGIRLGATMTQDQIMHALGVDKYQKDAQIDVWNNNKGCAEKPDQQVCKDAPFYKYGMRAAEWVENDIGPFCKNDSPGYFYCLNPQVPGTQPNWLDHGHGIQRVYVFVKDGVVSTIDIYFDSANAEDFFAVVHRQLGVSGWHVEHQDMFIADDPKEPKKGLMVDRTTETKKTSMYEAMMTDHDIIYTHVAGAPYQGVLEMKLLDQKL